MANEEHLKILKQGVTSWNQWSELIRDGLPDLREADLTMMDLARADLRRADLRGANFAQAHLFDADLSEADLREANLGGADLRRACLFEANLGEASLGGANLRGVDFRGADLSQASAGWTVFGDLDLSMVLGLETVRHLAPSTIGIDTLRLSGGNIPEVFLRGCGLSDWEIEAAKLYRPGLSNEEINDILLKIHDLRAHQALQISGLFISYSHADRRFIDHMETYLNKKGIRFWRDIHDATSGRLEKQIDRAIRHNPTVLLVLSTHSVQSDWVEHEARLARKLEKELERNVLCPVALDDSWKTCLWPERLREQIMEYNILDFSKWEDEAFFGRMFTKLIDGLDLFYKESA